MHTLQLRDHKYLFKGKSLILVKPAHVYVVLDYKVTPKDNSVLYTDTRIIGIYLDRETADLHVQNLITKRVGDNPKARDVERTNFGVIRQRIRG